MKRLKEFLLPPQPWVQLCLKRNLPVSIMSLQIYIFPLSQFKLGVLSFAARRYLYTWTFSKKKHNTPTTKNKQNQKNPYPPTFPFVGLIPQVEEKV